MLSVWCLKFVSSTPLSLEDALTRLLLAAGPGSRGASLRGVTDTAEAWLKGVCCCWWFWTTGRMIVVVPVAVCISGSVIRVRGETASPLSLSGKTTCYVKVYI